MTNNKSQNNPFICSGCGRRLRGRVFGRDSGNPQCKECYIRDFSTPEAAAKKGSILEAVRELEPELGEDKIDAAVEEAAGTLQGLNSILRQLGRDPGLLGGSSAATEITYRLIVLLQEADAENVGLPRCALCGRQTRLTATLEGDSRRRICQPCYKHNFTMVECSLCGRERPCARRTEAGEPLCPACYQRDPRGREICGICGELRRVHARADDGAAVCRRCHHPPEELCDVCGEFGKINSREDGISVCTRCYQRPQRRCGNCGRVRRIYRRASADGPDLCHTCAEEPIAVCSRCGQEGKCTGLKSGRPLCQYCRLADRVDEFLTADDGQTPEALRPLREWLLSVEHPARRRIWVNRSPALEILRRIARGELDLSHQALDELPRSTSLTHLRELLVSVGVLPWRDPYLARLEQAVAQEPEKIEDTEDELHLKAYGTWRVLRRSRRRYESGKAGISTLINARKRFYEAARFLRWLGEQDKNLTQCRQADIDLWLADGKTARYQIHDFISWAIERGMVPADITVPVQQGADAAGLPADLQGRVATARRLLHDGDLDLADRVVGALVVIYAQPLTRIARLTTEDVTVSNANSRHSELHREPPEEEVYLRIGQEWVLMPEPLGGLVKELKGRRWRREGISAEAGEDRGWLFPGRHPGKPQHHEYLRQRMKAVGIEARPSRNAALIQLTSELPPAVVADMLGITYETAERWSQRAQGRWSRYAASKARDLYGRREERDS